MTPTDQTPYILAAAALLAVLLLSRLSTTGQVPKSSKWAKMARKNAKRKGRLR